MTAVLPTPRERHPQLTPDPLRCPTTQRYFLEGQSFGVKSSSDSIHSDCSPTTESISSISSSVPSSIPSSPDFTPTITDRFSYVPTPSSLSPSIDDEHDDDELMFPSYDGNQSSQKDFKDQHEPEEVLSDTSASPSVDSQNWGWQTPAADDTLLEEEPTRHVDYLSHEWKEEDIWTSWRYVAARKNTYTNGLRLENAAWRTWMKLKFGLGTVSPESLNWLKDCDVTWLYGPLKTSKALDSNASPPPSRLETPNLYQGRKPILKKKTASETMLQRSLSQHTLLQHAGAILKAKEAGNVPARPSFSRSTSEFSFTENQTGSSTPTVVAGSPTNATFSNTGSPNEKRHIHFNNEVVQCIAVEAKDEDERDEYCSTATFQEDDPSPDDVSTRQTPPSASAGNSSPARNSFSHENKTIAPLPSTTLKPRGDTPEPPPGLMERWFGTRSTPLPSFVSSMGSRQPPQTSANFLLDDEDFDDGLDFSWQSKSRYFIGSEDDDGLETDQNHLTFSGALASGDYGESSNAGIFDRVTDTVNTAKDIAHVIWNVGWRQ